MVRAHGLSLVVALVLVTELGVPSFIPNEIPLLLVGAYNLPGPLDLAGAIAAVSAADLLGTTGLFLLIRARGGRLVARLLQGHAGERTLGRWRARLGRSRRRDVALVTSGRWLPLVRTPFAMTMALLGLETRRYVLGALLGALLWSSGPLVAGYLLRHRVEGVVGPLEHDLDAIWTVVGVLLALLAVAAVVRARIYARRPR